ncbi:hypothetical protein KQX54_015415 [Cotesia glomerata]|uniref:Uncharacterized protein n=1 Tax=Cotesia glomerata TaxID=32391 RepID=A0AAV7IT79_COTGL|nr:hypothetical protein KQX54_015415 [Cotesia glomerata]
MESKLYCQQKVSGCPQDPPRAREGGYSNLGLSRMSTIGTEIEGESWVRSRDCPEQGKLIGIETGTGAVEQRVKLPGNNGNCENFY